jgi:hypothetical protein
LKLNGLHGVISQKMILFTTMARLRDYPGIFLEGQNIYEEPESGWLVS